MENTVANMDQQMNGVAYPSGDDGDEVETVNLSETGTAGNFQGEQDSGNPDAQNPSGDAARTNYSNQEQINRAIGLRLHAAQQKHQKDIDLSGNIRSLFDGSTDEEIVEKLRGFAANDYATAKNIPVPIAEEVMGIRMQNRQPVVQQPETSPVSPNMQKLADEARAIEERYGVNLVQMIAESPDLQHRVFGQGVPLNDILIEHLQAQQPRKKAYAPISSPNGTGSAHQGLSDEQYEKIKEQLRQGKKVRI